MSSDEFWSSVYSGTTDTKRSGRFSVLRLALLFGSAAMALALIIPPMIDVPHGDWRLIGNGQGIDYTTTATIRRKREYTVHRSVLQSRPGAVCIINSDGRRSGDC
ncbi:hypothetical protein [Nitratireductor sp. XY-223]|uniref:hypothetical protein n=1 Tax=Nitratireductor sp. XY-223 TaxID=2561926 RepID=UPI001FEE7103|nr:hypothetical protein [Nitratireductor sp. XY-223]